MHLIIDGYNLLHVSRHLLPRTAEELQGKRDQLLDQLSSYRQTKPCDITVVFDGWQGGWATERRERRKGIDLIFSRLGEKADELIKRLAKGKGSGAVITSDRELARSAERLGAAVISSDQFRQKMGQSPQGKGMDACADGDEERGHGKKGPSRRLSRKEKRHQAALKKL